MIRYADISDNGLHRYRLSRVWDSTAPVMAWVMLNPSTADAEVDDPTIRRCIGFAKREGCGSIEVVNLYAYRATNPADLFDAAGAGIDVVGRDNKTAICNTFDRASVIVAGWGSTFADSRGWRLPRLNVESLATNRRKGMWCLGKTKTGYPRHPLYVRANQLLEPWGHFTLTANQRVTSMSTAGSAR